MNGGWWIWIEWNYEGAGEGYTNGSQGEEETDEISEIRLSDRYIVGAELSGDLVCRPLQGEHVQRKPHYLTELFFKFA